MTERRPRASDLARQLLSQARSDARKSGHGVSRRGFRRAADPVLSAAGSDDRDPQLMSDAVAHLLKERGWEAPTAVAAVTARWAEIVGAEVADHSEPAGFSDGVLVVRADSSAWATQLRILAPDLLRRLNVEVGHGTVLRVDVKGPAAPSWVKGRLSVRGRGPRDTYG